MNSQTRRLTPLEVTILQAIDASPDGVMTYKRLAKHPDLKNHPIIERLDKLKNEFGMLRNATSGGEPDLHSFMLTSDARDLLDRIARGTYPVPALGTQAAAAAEKAAAESDQRRQLAAEASAAASDTQNNAGAHGQTDDEDDEDDEEQPRQYDQTDAAPRRLPPQAPTRTTTDAPKKPARQAKPARAAKAKPAEPAPTPLGQGAPLRRPTRAPRSRA